MGRMPRNRRYISVKIQPQRSQASPAFNQRRPQCIWPNVRQESDRRNMFGNVRWMGRARKVRGIDLGGKPEVGTVGSWTSCIVPVLFDPLASCSSWGIL